MLVVQRGAVPPLLRMSLWRAQQQLYFTFTLFDFSVDLMSFSFIDYYVYGVPGMTLGSLPDKEVSEECDASRFRVGVFYSKNNDMQISPKCL